jgi:hypothetical protein
MPLTLPTHPVAVVPLKLWRPRWFDGVALILGAIAPDVLFALDGYGPAIRGHAWHAPLWWAVPFVLAVAPLVRWAAAPVAAHLPDAGSLALRDYGALATVRHRWWVTAWSAALGAATHIAWDAVTHEYVDGGAIEVSALHAAAPGGLPWFVVLCQASDTIGFGAAMALALHCGQSRLVRRWHGPPPATRRRPVLFWTVTVTVLAAGVATLPLHEVRSVPSQAVRAMLAVGIALFAGAVAHKLCRARNGTGADRDVVGPAQPVHGSAAKLRHDDVAGHRP